MGIKSHKRKKKLLIPSAIVCAFLVTSVSFAYLQWKGSVENTFTAEISSDPTVNEDFNGLIKKGVSVTVEDVDYSLYVRASIVVNWINADGEIYGEVPTPADYSMNLNLSADGWFKGNDGYYYYALPVNGGDTTATLINDCEVLADAPEAGYKLNVDVITQTLQVSGETDDKLKKAVTDAWGIKVVNGKLSI